MAQHLYEEKFYFIICTVSDSDTRYTYTHTDGGKLLLTAYGIRRDMNQFLWVISIFLLVVGGENALIFRFFFINVSIVCLWCVVRTSVAFFL